MKLTLEECIDAMKHINLCRVHPFFHWEEMKEVRDTAIKSMEKQIPKKPYRDNENGVYEKEYCPTCNRVLFKDDHHCTCGQAILWEDEE